MNRRARWAIALVLSLALSTPAFAMKKSTIVLKAAGSGAVLGAAAGVISYPFAKSAGVIITGAIVGAVLGTVIGFHLADRRQQAYESQSVAFDRPMPRDPTLAAREWQARRGTGSGASMVALPFEF